MKRTICLLLVICFIFPISACEGSGKKGLDFTELSRNTTYQDITKALGSEFKKNDYDDTYSIYYPDGTILSGIKAYDIYFNFSKTTDKLRDFEFWFSYKGDNIDAFNAMKKSLDGHYGKARVNWSSSWSRNEYYWNNGKIWCYVSDKEFASMDFMFR